MKRGDHQHTRGRAIAVGAIFGALLAAGIPAYAYWTDADGLTATLAAASLTDPVATAIATSTGVTVTVTAPTSGPAPTSYTITRDGITVCTLTGPGDCTENGLAPGTEHIYEVTAHLGENWVSTTAVTVFTVSSSATVLGADSPVGPAVAVHGDGDGLAESGESVTFTFDHPVTPADLCRGLAAALDEYVLNDVTVSLAPVPGGTQLTVQVPDGTCEDDGASALQLGPVNLASGAANSSMDVPGATPLDFVGSTIVLAADRTTVTLTLGAPAAGSPGTVSDPVPTTSAMSGPGGQAPSDGDTPVPTNVEEHSGSF